MGAITSPRAENISIGELSKQTGVNVETIRYYERIRRRYTSKSPCAGSFANATGTATAGHTAASRFAIDRPLY
jgi:MerR family regulatory protein